MSRNWHRPFTKRTTASSSSSVTCFFLKLTIALDEQAKTTFFVKYLICFGELFNNDTEKEII